MPIDLDKQVREMLASQTFEPDELQAVLVGNVHAEDDVSAAMQSAVADLQRKKDSPENQRRLARRNRARRSISAGVMVHVIGTVGTFFLGGGLLHSCW